LKAAFANSWRGIRRYWRLLIALLLARATLGEQLGKLQKRLVSLARNDTRARLLMTTPGVGVLVALTYVAAIDDSARFRSSKATGAHFGLTPRKYQSGETDVTGRISKIGDASVRTALYEAANVILTRPVKGSSLTSWAMRAGMRKAKVALARKLAVVRVRRRQGGRQSIDKGGNRRFGRTDTKRPEQVPSPGRWIRSGRSAPSGSYKGCPGT
jgi:transposase